ncbi:MAG: hypothetical protein GOP50_00140 [Candidatus Heimdallarchaeota archaeon]|nr:hypothetical protein [Candidatus Heimdallarchaeota archaeon]
MSEQPSPLKCVIIDIDFFIQEKEKEIEEPIIRIRGKTKENQPLIVHISGFYPYFFIDDIPTTTDAIQSLLYTEKEFGSWIKDHYPLTKNKYYQHKPIYLHKILGRNPWRILRYSKKLKDIGIKSYENDISYVSRFLIDNNIKGLNWIEISNFKEKTDKNGVRVVETNIENIKPIEDEIEFPLNILSLSIVINSITKEGKKIKNFSSVFEEKENRIVCASIAWGKNIEETKSKSFILEKDDAESERKLLFDLIKEIHAISPEVIVTFNGNQITLPYLIARMERLGLNPATLGPYQDVKIKSPIGYLGYRIPGYIVYDLVKSTRWLRTRTGRKRLSDFARELLNIEREGGYDKANNMWFNSVIRGEEKLSKKLKKLCDLDAIIVHNLFFEMGLEEYLQIVKLVGIRPSEGIYSTPRHIGEFQLFRVLHHKNTLIPAEPTREELAFRRSTRSQAIGGFVLVPKGTLHEAVLIADFRSMFPSVMVAFNVGGEGYNGAVALPEKKFRDEPDSGLRIMMRGLLKERKKIKQQIYDLETYLRTFEDSKKKTELGIKLHKLKTKSSALKITANSLYGSHNYVGSRFYDTEISNAITSIAKDYIKKVDKWTQEFSSNRCQAIYGDTDSIFIKLSDKDKVFEIAQKVKDGGVFSLEEVPEAVALFDFFETKLPKEMELEFVDLATRIVFAPETKKRYSYISAVTGELTITGFEAIRSDTSPFAKEVQTEALQCVLADGNVDKARKRVIELGLEFKQISEQELLDKTTILGPIRRNPKDYKSKTPAVGALEHFTIRMGLNINEIWKDYERFPYVIMEGDSALYKRAQHPSLADSSKIDKNHYLLEAVRDVQRIGVKVELRDLQSSSQKTLDFSSLHANGKNEED